jgi:hypothetical protein
MKTADHTVLIALVAAGTAILAAVIASATAIVLQRRQLEHARELQDLAELRAVLDEAVIALEVAINALTWVFVGVDHIASETTTDEEVKSILERGETVANREAMYDCAAARDRMMRAERRIAIRIAADQPLRAAYKIAIEIVIGSIRDIYARKGEQDAGEPVSSRDFADRAKELATARNTVIRDAVELAGSKV